MPTISTAYKANKLQVTSYKLQVTSYIQNCFICTQSGQPEKLLSEPVPNPANNLDSLKDYEVTSFIQRRVMMSLK